MVSSPLCPAVHISGSLNVYSRAEGIANHYWLRAVFSLFLSFFFYFPLLGSGPIGDNVLWYHHIPGTLCSLSLWWASDPAGRASKPAGRASEAAGRASEPARRARRALHAASVAHCLFGNSHWCDCPLTTELTLNSTLMKQVSQREPPTM